MKNLVILISSGGSNMAALARAARQDDWAQRLGARIAAVISNRPDAPGLDLARELDLPAEVVDHQIGRAHV
jgi:phosphoribosylglycinamide formyltransferase-1